MKSIKFYWALLCVIGVIMVACQNDDLIEDANDMAQLKSVIINNEASSDVAEVTLYAGQTIDVGSLVVEETDQNEDGVNDAISVSYQLKDGWLIEEIHFWVGENVASMPQTKKGNPQVGQFPYKPTGVSGSESYTLVIPFTNLNYNTCDANFVAAAHASVFRNGQNETAWAAGTGMNVRGSWATYFNIELVDDKAPLIVGSIDDVVVEGCSADDAPVAVNSVEEIENLGLSVSDTRCFDHELTVSSVDEISGSCPIVLTRTYEITDKCGNSSIVKQSIVIEDTIAPVLTGQGENGTANSMDAVIFTAPTASDNCGSEVEVDFQDETVVSGNYTTVTRTWTATDKCGNAASASQSIVVNTGINPLNKEGECNSWQTETAFAGNDAGTGRAWWYSYSGTGKQTIWAGQHINVGTVEFKNGNLVLTLTDGWELQDDSESVKIQGYGALPDSRPAAGQFTTYKGTDLTIAVGAYNYYVIHLDVRKCLGN